MLLIGNGRLITRGEHNRLIENGCVAADGSVIAAVGTTDELRRRWPDAQFIDAHGGMILPGPKAALNALVKGTAQLPQVDLDAPRAALAPLAKNSAACLQAGSILGTAAMLDGLIARLRGELGENAWVAATGELPEAVLKAMAQPVRRCEDLILDGMNLIWLKNQK